MAAPTNTYDSNTDLSLGNVPNIDTPEDMYRELLDLHNAIETLLTSSDATDAIFQLFIDKQRNNTAVTTNYTILITDGTIEVDASGGDVTITLPLAVDGSGYRYDIKRVDTTTANAVTLVGTGGELVDARASGIKISTKSSYTVKGNDDDDGYNII